MWNDLTYQEGVVNRAGLEGYIPLIKRPSKDN